MSTAQSFEFQAETRRLMELVIHSVYSQKEVFLRELISNASDAIDKRRFLALTDKNIIPEEDNHIRIEIDKATRRLTISDTGIGMSREEVIQNIGTIARSGTRELLEKLKNSKESFDLIGQFGVGFYSAFMVADKVTLITRRADEKEGKATRWVSTGEGTYTIEDDTRPTPGTTIILDLKPADKENGLPDFCDEFEIEMLVKKYSDFIAYPIRMKKTVHKTVGEGKNAKTEETVEDVTLNSMKPLWTRSKNEIKDEDYNEFYKHIAHDWEDPLKVIHYRAEGRIEYTALLYIPRRAPFDLYFSSFKGGLQLYVKKVMVAERAEELLPRYLRFVRGVVESADLPLNISRELLQQDRHISAIRKGLTSKILAALSELLEKDREGYSKFYREFGPALKEGTATDIENKEKIASLLLFASSFDKEKTTTLGEYVGRMKPDQKYIYYLTGDSRSALDSSPHTESLRAKGYEILYLLDAYDEIVLQNLGDFSGKKFQSATRAEPDPDSKEKAEAEKKAKEAEKAMGALLGCLREHLKDQVKDVKFSSVLVSAPARLVGEEFDLSPYLERILARNGEKITPRLKTLEINPDHELIRKLFARYEKNPSDPQLADYAHLLLGYAVIADGGEIRDVARFNQALAGIAVGALQ